MSIVMHIIGTITVNQQEGDIPKNNNKGVVFKSFACFAGCVSAISNTQMIMLKTLT